MSDEKDGFNDANDCDVVVDISSEVDHINNPQVNEWLKPDDNGFRPTPQQEKFRSLAYRLAQRKRFFRGEWYKATKKKESFWAENITGLNKLLITQMDILI